MARPAARLVAVIERCTPYEPEGCLLMTRSVSCERSRYGFNTQVENIVSIAVLEIFGELLCTINWVWTVRWSLRSHGRANLLDPSTTERESVYVRDIGCAPLTL